MKPPPLKNDCFALPPGVDWTPVDQALAHLRDVLHPVVGQNVQDLDQAIGLFLTSDVFAKRSNPPLPNSAVDGFGFKGPIPEGVQDLPLVEGRAAAGLRFNGAVPAGSAIRILTGAALPDGVDTVVLEEDTTRDPARIMFHGPLKAGANTRRAGEDVKQGALVLSASTLIGAPELAILTATGISEVSVFDPLKVAVLSTGDELCDIEETAEPGQIYDANGPMLCNLFGQIGVFPRSLGQARDNREEIRAILNQASQTNDAIIVSGGASAGDEDHVSALLEEMGSKNLWRIAMKPGRPMAFGLWNGVPIFGLPGNPVAACVCALVFVIPALRVLAGGGWRDPVGYMVPAGFSKNKKPGRREFLRARIGPDGRAEAFASEGSGRISGLAWANGLVEISDGAQTIKPGDMVRYIPFSSFGT